MWADFLYGVLCTHHGDVGAIHESPAPFLQMFRKIYFFCSFPVSLLCALKQTGDSWIAPTETRGWISKFSTTYRCKSAQIVFCYVIILKTIQRSDMMNTKPLSEENRNFLSNLKYLRRQHNLTQKQMAQILGISITTWRKMEQGIMPPRLSTLVVYRAADAFGIPAIKLFSKTP